MKIYLNREPVTGPWGGGNKTLSSLCEKILTMGHNITFDLEADIDIIFCYDPRPNKKGIWYQNFLEYKRYFPKSKIIHRVGDVGSHSKPELTKMLREIVKQDLSDFYIFPSIWAREMVNHIGENFSLIENRPMPEFYKNRKNKRVDSDQINIVTHHWSTNDKKGFDIYSKLGEYLKSNKINGKKVNVTYIGRYSEKYPSECINLVLPIDADTLACEIPKYDFYLTASLEEAGANHVLEGLACGLPILYRSGGGSINEYCKGFGKEYSSLDSLISSLVKIDKDYDSFKESVLLYNEVINTSVTKYVEIIDEIGNAQA